MPISLRVFGLTLLAATLVHFIPRFGIPLQSDVTWLYRLQAARIDAAAIPYGLSSFGGRPMDPLSACVSYYDAYGRWDCVDVLVMRGIATFAGEQADLWRASFLLLGSLSVTLLVLLLRRLAVPWLPTVVLATGALVSPLELWGEYTAAEAKALPVLLGAITVALSSRGTRGQSAAAVLWVVAVFAKEPFAAAWPAVAAAAVAGPGLPHGVGEIARRIAPHAAALTGLVLFVLALGFRPPEGDYPFLLTSTPLAAGEWLRTYLSALQPALLRGWPLALGLVAAFLAMLPTIRNGQERDGLRRQVLRADRIVLSAGLLAAIAGHGAVYALTRRVIGDSRYVVPASAEALILLGVTVAAVAAALPRPVVTRVWTAAALGIGLGAIIRWAGDGAALLAIMTAIIGGTAAAILGRGSAQRIQYALVGAALVLVLSAPLDSALDDAATARIDQDAWRQFQDDVLRAAPPRGHIVLSFRDAPMVEHAWGLETFTLLAGRTDLVYHLEILDPAFFETETGLVRAIVAAINHGRAALPAGRSGVLGVQADRLGRGGWRREQLGPMETLGVFARSPGAWMHRRYVAGKTPYLRWAITPSHTFIEGSTALLVP